MSVKSFGLVLIGSGVFIIFAFFAFSEWRGNLNFIENLRYATLFEIASDTSNKTTRVPLGQCLLLPLLIIGLGFVVKHEIISSKTVVKILPFLDDRSNEK